MPNTPEKAMTDEIRNKPLMWSYQQSFRVYAGIIINAVMQELGVSKAGAECLLVGARIPSHQNPNDVCVEPEEDKWSISLFEGLLEAIEAEFASHPMQKMFYTDRTSMEEKPENIRRDSVLQGRAEGTGLRTDRTGLPAGAVASFSPAARTATGNVSNRSRPRGENGDAGSERRRSTWGKFPGCQCKAEVSSSRLTIQPLSVWEQHSQAPSRKRSFAPPPE